MMMIHFDIDIPGVDLQNFSADAIPFSLWPEEASVSPAQVNLFTSLIQQAEQPSAISPAMENTTKPHSSASHAPEGNIATPKSFVFRAFTSAPLPAETTAAQISAPQTQIAETTAAPQPATVYASARNLESLEPLENLDAPVSQISTVAQKPIATATQFPVEHTALQSPAPQPQAAATIAQSPAPQPKVAETIAKPQPATVYASARNLASLESLEPLENLESLEYQAATATQKPLAMATQMPAEFTAAQIPAMHAQAEAFATQEPSLHAQAAVTATKPQLSTVYASARNLESLEPLEILEAPEYQAATVAQKPLAMTTQMPAEFTAAQIPAPNAHVAVTVAKPQPATVVASARILESLEPLENLEPLASQAATVTQKSVATANQTPAEFTAPQSPAPQPHATATSPQPKVAENTAKPQPATVFASARNLESLEPLENLEVPEYQAATVAQKPLATATQIPVEHTAPQISTPQSQAAATAAQVSAPQTQTAETTAKPQSATVYASARNLASLESLEPLENLESLEKQAATATQIPVATANQIPVEHTAPQSPAPHAQAATTAAQVSAPQTQTAETTAKPQPATVFASARNLESLESLADLEVPEYQAATVAQKPIATATQIPVEHTAPQTTALHAQITATALQSSAPQTKVAENTAKPQTATVYVSAENLESLETLENLEFPEHQTTTVAQKPVATANQIPVEHAAVQIPAPQTQAAETTAKPTPSIAYAYPKNLASLESLEPLADLEVLEYQAATATQKPVAAANQIPVEHTAPQIPAPQTKASVTAPQIPAPHVQTEATATHNPAPQPKVAENTAKPLPSTVYASVRNLESPEPLAVLEVLENQAATVAQKPLATANQIPVEHTAPQTKATVTAPQFSTPHTQAEAIATQEPALHAQTTATVAESLPSTVYAFARNPESPEPLANLVVLENQAATVAQKPVATANQIPVEHTTPQTKATVTAPQMPAPHVQVEAIATQDPAPQTKATVTAPQMPVSQPKVAENTAKPQLATVYASARNLESPEPLANLESLENQASTATQKPVATANPIPMETVAPQIPASQPQATMVKMMPQAAPTPKHAAAVPQQSETVAPQRNAMPAPVDPQPSTKHVSAKESKSLETAAATIAPAAQQQTVAQPPSLDLPSIMSATISKLAISPNEILASALNELTSAIMVNIDESGHLGEIRLVLNPDVLDGTTILLKCDQKQISVTFFPGAASAEQLLVANQSRIVETLAATGHLPVQLSIITSEGRRQIRKSVA